MAQLLLHSGEKLVQNILACFDDDLGILLLCLDFAKMEFGFQFLQVFLIFGVVYVAKSMGCEVFEAFSFEKLQIFNHLFFRRRQRG